MKSHSDDRHFLSAEVTLSTPFVWTEPPTTNQAVSHFAKGADQPARETKSLQEDRQVDGSSVVGSDHIERETNAFSYHSPAQKSSDLFPCPAPGLPYNINVSSGLSVISSIISFRFLCIVVRLLCLPVLWFLYSLVLLLVDHVIELHLSSEIESKQVFQLSLCLTPLSMCSRFTSSGADQLLVSIFLQRGRIKVRSKTGLDVLY